MWAVAEVFLQTHAFAPAYAPVSAIREDGAGTLWVGTFGDGLQAVAGGKVIKALTGTTASRATLSRTWRRRPPRTRCGSRPTAALAC